MLLWTARLPTKVFRRGGRSHETSVISARFSLPEMWESVPAGDRTVLVASSRRCLPHFRRQVLQYGRISLCFDPAAASPLPKQRSVVGQRIGCIRRQGSARTPCERPGCLHRGDCHILPYGRTTLPVCQSHPCVPMFLPRLGGVRCCLRSLWFVREFQRCYLK